MATLQDFKKDLPLMVEMGLIAIKQGDEESAKKLFNSVAVIDPESTMKKMGYGLIAIHKMDIKNGISLFEEILQVEPANYRAQAFLGFAYLLSTLKEETPKEDKLKGLKKGIELAQDVLNKSQSATTKQLAQSLIDWEKELATKVESSKGPIQ